MSVAGIVLAAGRSTRMGDLKLLRPYRGRPLLCAALDAMAASGAAPALCVLGFRSEDILRAVDPRPCSGKVRFLVNPEFGTGRASSVRLALHNLPRDSEAAVFLPGDMPLVRSSDVRALIERFRLTRAPIVAAVEETGKRTQPVLFARRLFPVLAALRGDASGHAIIEQLWNVVEKVHIPGDRSLDIDREDDYRSLLDREWSERAPLL